jgi:hypothetical protein
MRKYFGCAAAVIAVMICGSLAVGPAFGQQLVGGFEQTLVSTAGGTPFGGQWTASPEYTTTGATEGTHALVVHHSPSWVTDGLFLKGGLPFAQQAAANDLLIFDATTTDLGVAADGWAPGFRQVFPIFNSNSGGWMQNQIDFPVAADGGGSLTTPVILDLAATGIKANAQTFVDSGNTEPGAYWELFLIFQGGDQGKPGDYAADNGVNAADYVTWRDTVGGTTLTNETVSLGSVDSEDYTEWKAKFGNDYSKITTIIDNVRFVTAGSGAVLGVAGVPEPTSALLGMIAVSAVAVGRRGRRLNEV